MIGDRIQHYRIVRQLGAGGMGVVYEAEDTRLGRHVAIKFLPEAPGLSSEAVDRFEREARIASSLNHPNICTIFDVGSDRGRRYIVMELLDGESLRSKVRGHPLPLEQILDVGVQLAAALDAAHAKGIVHRDIKPANVLITRRGQAKLLDFGVAKLSATDDEGGAETHEVADVLTTPGTAVGSINYMSPEQARSEDLDGRTDLFSLGLVLYEMATGRQAFGGHTTAVVFDAILNRRPPDPRALNPNVPEELQRVITRALEKDRRMRFQTAADMLAELGRIRRDTSGRTAVAAPASSAPPASRARWLAMGMPALLIALAAGYYFWTGTRTPALTEKDTLLVADFVNTTGDPVFDDALKQAVSVQLQQTPFLTLMPHTRVAGTLALMQRAPDDPVTRGVAREACQRAGARATVEGSIAPIGSAYVITLGVHNCQTGAPLAQEQVQAATKEEVLGALGGAVTTLRRRLGESLSSIEQYDVPVTEATTKSLEALRAYGQGVRVHATKGLEASIPFFTQAVERDPDFALAYAKLAVVTNNLGRQKEAREYSEKAYSYRDRVSQYERLYIDWSYASHVLRDHQAVQQALEVQIAAYPRDFVALNNFGVHSITRGQYEEALKQYKAAMDIAPDEPLPISNSAYALLHMGRFDEGSAMTDRALAVRPNAGLALTRWLAAVAFDSPAVAEYEAIASKFATPDQMMAARASAAIWRGQLVRYRAVTDQVIAKARADGNEGLVRGIESAKLVVMAFYEDRQSMNDLRSAVAAAEREPVSQAVLASVLASLGDDAPARAVLPRLQKAAETDENLREPVGIAAAQIRAASGEAREAVASVESALEETPRNYHYHFIIGQMRASMDDVAGAIAAYQQVITARGLLVQRVPLLVTVPASRLELAELLLKQGNPAGAREQLDALLRQWKDADTEFEMLTRVRQLRAKI